MSVLNDYRDSMFQRVPVTLRFNNRLVGGVPNDPKMVAAWLRKKMGITSDQELFELTKRTLMEAGVDTADAVTIEDLFGVSDDLAEKLKTQVFKRNEDGNAYIEARQIKAGIKESVNILFAKQKWGPTGKGAPGFTAERVFVDPADERIIVGTEDDVLVDTAVGHFSGPTGPVSTIGYYEYVVQPTISFTLVQLLAQNTAKGEPALSLEQIYKVFAHMELNGLGAKRSQGFGQFEVLSILGLEDSPRLDPRYDEAAETTV